MITEWGFWHSLTSYVVNNLDWFDWFDWFDWLHGNLYRIFLGNWNSKVKRGVHCQ